ncbi:uncharacterized protein AKAW2_60572A [Aspergillus luchuensis]|uniref:Uncharacterized protein n=1 Tax=Aspergillus kawachii TaxID=1069201 RepID=A0A146FYE0_ASPKA|nr:uncharacterized protein AKAW2_60572A [Aspergillus luchuensis]BCS02308.1 hypothetical protein AKAW2_60572A [Aspergillus luchuensis]BCS13988.1 hypothetical protein ALUC_60544A [Aspergillus luchuensis]GAA86321.1 hypothetical protein AKAW_04435 [Aspergillus luchuensis IFO 4308]GAT30664.1 hypothetical protein RIB2604_03600020 [Aspergillus luchuensis]
MATPALVPAPALPPDLSFSVPNPAKFSASPKQELRRYVAWLLRESEVPAFLWGPEVTRIYGSNTDFEYSMWAVKDEAMKKAVQVLNEAGLRPCKKGRRCAKHRSLPFPDQHYHKVLKHFNTHVSHGVYLYRKSRFFPHFPDPPLVDPKPDDRYYMLSSDKRLPDWSYSCVQVQRMSKDGYPVIIPTPARYLEAVCLQSVRHYEVQDGSYFWNEERCAMIHILEDRFTDTLKLDDLDEPWHEYGKLNIDRGYGDRAGDYGGQKYRLFLYLDMKKKGQLPPPETKARDRWLRPIPDLVREWGLPLDLLD